MQYLLQKLLENGVVPKSSLKWLHGAALLFSSMINVNPCEEAPRTERCSNRCGFQIFCDPLSGENLETKAAMPLKNGCFNNL